MILKRPMRFATFCSRVNSLKASENFSGVMLGASGSSGLFGSSAENADARNSSNALFDGSETEFTHWVRRLAAA